MAITFFGVASTPADNGANVTNPTVITPPASMVAGDLVLIFAHSRATTGTLSMSQAGGQTWTSLTQHNATTCRRRIFWARFNGTWSANPSVTIGTTCSTAVMLVFRPTGSNYSWRLDQALTDAVVAAPASPFTVSITGKTIGSNSVCIAAWACIAANTWGSLSGAGWSKTGLSAQYRNTSGSDQSSSYAYFIGSGATGNVSQNESAGTAGASSILSFQEFPIWDDTATAGKTLGISTVSEVFTPPTFDYRNGTTAGNASGTDVTIDKPTGVVDGDILVAVLYREAGVTWTLPAGWAWLITDYKAFSFNAWVSIAWKRASGEGANWTFQLSGTSWRVVAVGAFYGAQASGDPFDASKSSNTADITAITALSITTGAPNEIAILATGNFNGDDPGVGSTGYSLGPLLGGCGFFYKAYPSAGATGDVSPSRSAGSSGDWVAHHVALIQDTGGGGSTYEDATTLGKNIGLAPGNVLGAENATTLGKTISFQDAGALALPGALGIGRIMDVSGSAAATLPGAANLGKVLGITDQNQLISADSVNIGKILALSTAGAQDIVETLALGKNIGAMSQGGLLLSADFTLGEILGAVTMGGGVFEDVVTLSELLGYSGGGSVTVDAGAALGLILGIAAASEVGAIEAILTLGKVIGTTQAPALVASSAVNLGRINSATPASVITMGGAVALGKILSASSIGGIDLLDALTIGKILTTATNSLVTKEESVSLARSLGITELTQADINAAAVMGTIRAISESSLGSFETSVMIGKILTAAQVTNLNAQETVALQKALEVLADGGSDIDVETIINKTLGYNNYGDTFSALVVEMKMVMTRRIHGKVKGQGQ